MLAPQPRWLSVLAQNLQNPQRLLLAAGRHSLRPHEARADAVARGRGAGPLLPFRLGPNADPVEVVLNRMQTPYEA